MMCVRARLFYLLRIYLPEILLDTRAFRNILFGSRRCVEEIIFYFFLCSFLNNGGKKKPGNVYTITHYGRLRFWFIVVIQWKSQFECAFQQFPKSRGPCFRLFNRTNNSTKLNCPNCNRQINRLRLLTRIII